MGSQSGVRYCMSYKLFAFQANLSRLISLLLGVASRWLHALWLRDSEFRTGQFSPWSSKTAAGERTYSTHPLTSPNPPTDAVAINSAESVIPESLPESHCHAVVEANTASQMPMMA